jgi:ABC-2 type transport system permease protein
MIAKIVPYIVIGYIQVALILVAAALVFQLPIRGSVPLLMLALGLFIASNLALGLTFSTIATNQMQAQQLAQFTLLPSFLLSGFLFPFRGMPLWAQWIGETLPTTHAIRIVRGILLKGNGASEILPRIVADGAVRPSGDRRGGVVLLKDAGLRDASAEFPLLALFDRLCGAFECLLLG